MFLAFHLFTFICKYYFENFREKIHYRKVRSVKRAFLWFGAAKNLLKPRLFNLKRLVLQTFRETLQYKT